MKQEETKENFPMFVTRTKKSIISINKMVRMVRPNQIYRKCTKTCPCTSKKVFKDNYNCSCV